MRDHSPKPAVRPAVPWLLLEGDAQWCARALPDAHFDLIYTDPPFCTGRSRRAADGTAFEDRWSGGPDAYIAWLEPRLAEMRRLLAPSGSLFVHLDWHVCHAVKLLLDRLFGPRLFINEIIWSYRTGGSGRRRLACKHDTIFFYARSRDYKFHSLCERSDLSHAYGFANANVLRDERGPYRMARLRDVWEIPALRGNMPERIIFPTQKPLALMKRIVNLATDPQDLIGDFFCGSGTTLVAAVTQGRRAVGGDVSRAALHVTAARLKALDDASP
ncbi:MAG: site-specific DNA-methyltransferase [Candidatus Eisenbacteria bacterium]